MKLHISVALKRFERLDLIDEAWADRELKKFHQFLKEIPTTSERSYSKSHENVRKLYYDYLHEKLDASGFVNAQPKENTWEKNPKAAFWWSVYTLTTFPYDHHCSSEELKKWYMGCIEKLLVEISLPNQAPGLRKN